MSFLLKVASIFQTDFFQIMRQYKHNMHAAIFQDLVCSVKDSLVNTIFFVKPEIRLNPSFVNKTKSESRIKTKTFSCEHKTSLLAFTRFSFFRLHQILCTPEKPLQIVTIRTEDRYNVMISSKSGLHISKLCMCS